MALAGPGQILTTEVARTITHAVEFADVGERTLQGIDGAWRLYAVEEPAAQHGR